MQTQKPPERLRIYSTPLLPGSPSRSGPGAADGPIGGLEGARFRVRRIRLTRASHAMRGAPRAGEAEA